MTEDLPRLRGRVDLWAGVGLIAAAVAYALHHAPPLANHDVVPILLAVGLATLTAIAVARTVAARTHPPLPVVLGPTAVHAEVRRSMTEDIPFSASLHAEALPHGFFVALGPGFLRAYHATFTDSPHAVAFVATVGELPVGFLLGVLHPQAHMRWVLRRRGIRLAAVAALALLSRPRVVWRFLRTRVIHYLRAWRRHRGGSDSAQSPVRRAAVLSHVAVVEGARGAGAGSDLVSSFLVDAREAGSAQALVATLEGSDGAASFYRRQGWTDAGVHESADGTRLRSFVLDLRTSS